MTDRLLVVDDNALNAKLLQVLLTRAGFEVEVAADAVEARAAIARTPPHLILMDLQLPGVDGYALTAELKGNEATHQIPIIAVTACAMRGDDVRALDAGCDGHMTKPIDTRTFVQSIRDFLDGWRGSRG